MANVKITDLTAYTNPASTDVLPIVDVGADVTKKVSIADLLENAGSGTAAAPGIAFDGDGDTGIYRPGANQVAISTNGTGRLFVDANGNVGLGTSSPTSTLHVVGSSAPIIENTGTSSLIRFTNSAASNVFVGSDSTSAVFLTGSTERVRVDSSGYLRLSTNSGGIQFNGDTAAANALDDYEEGSWTPTGGTWSGAGGTYIKIGRTVVVNGYASAGGGQTLTLNEIGGLPFAYLSGSAGNGSYMVYQGQGNPPTGLTIIPGAYGNTLNIGSTSLKFFPTFSRTNSGLAGGDRIQFTVVYQV